jgi:hypothetical protein
MTKQIKLVSLELEEIDFFQASVLKHVQIFDSNLDNTDWIDAEILYMGEFVCVYKTEYVKERSSLISDLMFRQNEAKAAKVLLRSQMPFNVSNMNIDDIISRIIQLGYRQIVKSE